MKQRDLSLDILRILACFMVVLMHSPLPSEHANGPFLTGLSYLTAPCIGLFFMVSGALLMPVKTDYFTFLKRRFGKIIVPTVLWSLLYIALNIYNSESEINILQSIASIPLSAQGEGVLWFMYTLAGLYLLAPILSAWVEKASKRELQLILSLWGVTLCYPIFDFFLLTNTSTTGILYFVGGYGGYFLLGCYLKKYPDSLSSVALWGITLCGIGLLLCLKHLGIRFDFYQLFWYESIFIAAFATAIWKLVVYNSSNMSKYKDVIAFVGGGKSKVVLLSNISFGVYFIHILIMRHWLWNMEWIRAISNYPLQCVTIAVLTMLLSTAACIVIAILPRSEWIIGFHLKRNRASTT